MALIPFKPFDDLDKFFEDDFFLPVFFKNIQPAMDIYETDKEVVVEANLPGVDPEKIDISVKDGILRIAGIVEEKKEEKKKGYLRKEIKKGTFERAVSLPTAVKEDKAEATYENGVLKIVIPKAKEEKKKKIKVKVKK